MRVEWVRTAVTASLAVAYGSPPNASALPVPSALCLPPSLVRGAEIVLLDQHGGRGATSNLNLADSRHPTHVVSVEAGSSGKPVVLIVSAYEPTVWDVSAVDSSRLRAVVAYGFYPPAVTGNAPTTAVRFGALGRGGDWLGSPGCDPIDLAFSGTGQVGQYSDQVKSVFGVGPSQYFGGFDPSGYDLDTGGLPSARPTVRANVEPVLPTGVRPGVADAPRRAGNAFAAGGSINTSLRWAEGQLVLPRHLGEPAPEWRNRVAMPRRASVRVFAPKDHRNDGMDLLLGLLCAGAIGSLGLAWYRRTRLRFGWIPAEQPEPAGGADEFNAPVISIKDLNELCTEDASRSAIQRFQEAANALQKAVLDPDLREQALIVIARDAAQLASATYRAMSSTDRPKAIEQSSREAVERLTAHLYRLGDEQRQRDADALGTTQGFLRARYPSPDDPFALR
jgi:hypothetical protein